MFSNFINNYFEFYAKELIPIRISDEDIKSAYEELINGKTNMGSG